MSAMGASTGRFVIRARVWLMRWAGPAGMLGGALWVVKGGGVILTGDQPPTFEPALFLFGVGLLGLYARLDGRGGRVGRAGGVMACMAVASAMVTAIAALVAPAWMPDGEGDITPLTPAITLAGLGTFLGLSLLGIATLRAKVLSPGWNALPLAMGVSAVPLMLIGGILEVFSDRLFELPIVLLGLAWMMLGYALWSNRDEQQRATAGAGAPVPAEAVRPV